MYTKIGVFTIFGSQYLLLPSGLPWNFHKHMHNRPRPETDNLSMPMPRKNRTRDPRLEASLSGLSAARSLLFPTLT